jgi:hypothetical protein
MSLFWLNYRVGGSLESVAIIEAPSLGAAWLRAAALRPAGECQGEKIDPDDATMIPGEFVGRLLGEDELADLERTLVARTPKKRAAASARRTQNGRRAPGWA